MPFDTSALALPPISPPTRSKPRLPPPATRSAASAQRAGKPCVDEAPPRVLVDTNVWVSAFINPDGAPAQVVDAFLEDRFVPVTSRALSDGIHEVLRRPRISRRWGLSDEELASVLALLQDRAVEAIPPGELRLCRDPDDNIMRKTPKMGRWRRRRGCSPECCCRTSSARRMGQPSRWSAKPRFRAPSAPSTRSAESSAR
ncbi:MAG: putative toxin-antitoxin system toxin component, PIN family [Chloroflexi bacterium]|nr:putative toxin-antitoxin system toxin component, PIN family [Chloroflexota bacterium]